MQFKKTITIILTLAMLTLVAVQPSQLFSLTAAGKSVSQMEQEKQAAKANAAKAQKELEELRRKNASQEDILKKIREKRANVEKQIDICNEQLETLNKEIKEKEAQIAQKEDELKETKDLFAQRVRAMYISGGSAGLEILMGSEDFADYLVKAEMLRSVSQQDTALMQNISDTIQEINKAKQTVLEKKADQKAVQKELVARQAELESEYKSESAVKANIQSNISDTQSALDKYKAAVDRLEDEIKEAQRQAQQSNIKYSGGAFAWPVPGYYSISSPYGWRAWDGRFHKGIDISSGGIYGKSIVAPADGQVIKVSYDTYGYGKYLMINHGSNNGNQYITLFGHTSSILVSSGQTVTKGQVIARVGSTGQSTGPHLHFEIRVNGVAQNPMNFYK